MESLHIKQLKTRYRLPVSSGDASIPEMRKRLDCLLKEVMDEALEAALEYEGIGSHEEICIRQVHAPVRLRLAESDQILIDQWSQSLAQYIRRAIDEGSSGAVVRYPARINGYVDFATGVALGCLNRAWAWNQLGIADLAESASQLAAQEQLLIALEREPHFIVPVLKQLVGQGHFQALALRFSTGDWQVLAQAAQQAVGGSWRAGAELKSILSQIIAQPLSIRLPAESSVSDLDDEAVGLPNSAESRLWQKASETVVVQLAHSLLARSSIWRALLAAPQHYRSAQSSLESLLVLMVLEVEPTLMRQQQSQVEELLFALAMVLIGSDSGKGDVACKKQRRAESDTAGKVVNEKHQQTQNDSTLAQRNSEQEQQVTPPNADEPAVEEYPLPTPVAPIETDFGGLLYLLSLVDALELPDAIVATPCFEQRPFQWVLYHLALNLIPLNELDPALLAFCGLGGEEELPWRDQPELSEAEQQWFDQSTESLVQLLRERLVQHPDQPLQGREFLLDRVCRRQAQIISEPGWLEVVFPFDTVSTEIRRAALDLDPGYLPWLGQVVKVSL